MCMAVKQAGTSRLEVKLPERLHEALRQLAEKERRTITAQVVVLIERATEDGAGA
jgi:hypothetical protein